MKKKLISVVLAAAAALSLGASAVSAQGYDVSTGTAIPSVKVTWPTNDKVSIVLNPYALNFAVPATGTAIDPTKSVAASATTINDSIISTEFAITNSDTKKEAFAITVSKFEVKALVTKNADGTAIPADEQTASKNIKIVKVPPKHDVQKADGTITPGDTYNSILLYLEASEPVTGTGVKNGTYSAAFDAKNTRILIADVKAVSKEKFFNVPSGTTVFMKVRGEMTQNPKIPWSKIAETEQVVVNLVFDIAYATPYDAYVAPTP